MALARVPKTHTSQHGQQQDQQGGDWQVGMASLVVHSDPPLKQALRCGRRLILMKYLPL
jgi:hypothetical protein